MSSSDGGDPDRRFRKNLITYEPIESFGIKNYKAPKGELTRIKSKGTIISKPGAGPLSHPRMNILMSMGS